VGTAPNAVFAGMAVSQAGREVAFVEWMAVGVPFVLIALPIAWWIVNRFTLRLPDAPDAPIEAPERPAWQPGEPAVLAVLLGCFALWLTRQPVDLGVFTVPGWGGLLPKKVDDGFVAMAAAITLFVLPRRGGGFLLDWGTTAKALPWGVLTLLGGGFAMANGIQASGLTGWIAQATAGLGDLSLVPRTLVICASVAFLSAFTSNTATTQVVLPLLAAGATAAGANPVLWMLPATISASCDFAIAAEAGGVRAADMAFAGLFLNVICAGVATLVVVTLGVAVFG
jgi:sodium-dependent dicarboxylate transporter 2/3/5